LAPVPPRRVAFCLHDMDAPQGWRLGMRCSDSGAGLLDSRVSTRWMTESPSIETFSFQHFYFFSIHGDSGCVASPSHSPFVLFTDGCVLHRVVSISSDQCTGVDAYVYMELGLHRAPWRLRDTYKLRSRDVRGAAGQVIVDEWFSMVFWQCHDQRTVSNNLDSVIQSSGRCRFDYIWLNIQARIQTTGNIAYERHTERIHGGFSTSVR
jgi:hypothetical protein